MLRSSQLCLLLALSLLLGGCWVDWTFAPGGPSAAQPIEGFGAVTRGALDSPDGYETVRVTSLADSGPGTLREALSAGKRLIVFDVGGEITLESNLDIDFPYITIDGATAPEPGITLRKAMSARGRMEVHGTHDVVIRHLRYQGLYDGTKVNGAATITIDGDTPPDRKAERIVFDHLTLRNGADRGPDIWGEVRDVTLSWCFVFYSRAPTAISHFPAPYYPRENISFHHNVYAKNSETAPIVRGDVTRLDFVNNVIYDWGYLGGSGYGMQIRAAQGEPSVNANIVNNVFALSGQGTATNFEAGLVYGKQPGPDSEENVSGGGQRTQSTVVSSQDLGELYVRGNRIPAQNRDHYSTVPTPHAIPQAAQVTTYEASELSFEVLPKVGARYRTAEEQRLLDEIADLL